MRYGVAEFRGFTDSGFGEYRYKQLAWRDQLLGDLGRRSRCRDVVWGFRGYRA